MTEAINPFVKTRGDHSVETSEDYVEAIMRLAGFDRDVDCDTAPGVRTVDIAKVFGVAQPTATKVLNRLEKEGLVCVHRRRSVHLTIEGLELARACLERHNLVLNFLIRIGVSNKQAELDTEGVEHHLSEETLAAIRKLMTSLPVK